MQNWKVTGSRVSPRGATSLGRKHHPLWMRGDYVWMGFVLRATNKSPSWLIAVNIYSKEQMNCTSRRERVVRGLFLEQGVSENGVHALVPVNNKMWDAMLLPLLQGVVRHEDRCWPLQMWGRFSKDCIQSSGTTLCSVKHK